MRSRPVLLVLTLMLIVGAIAAIELQFGAASTEGARVTADVPSGERETGEESVDGAEEPPVVREPGTRSTENSGAAEERVERKEAEFVRAKEIVAPTGFINTDGVSIAGARGEKVVLLEFWTYSCYNCRNTHPYVNAWHEKYEDDGLLIVGVHKPEFEFEKDPASVEAAVREAGIEYPVVLDNDDATWDAYDQRYWPTRYLIDADGFIRHRHIGEGAYEETEAKIRQLLSERDRLLEQAG